MFSPTPFMPYRPIPGLVWSKQNFEPSAIPHELAKLNLISGKVFENSSSLLNCFSLIKFLKSSEFAK